MATTRNLQMCAMALALGLAPGVAAAQNRGAGADGQQPPIQARPGGPELAPRTNQEQPVAKGTRLVLTNNAGEVVVRSWDRDAVKIEATHNERDSIDVQTAEQTLRIRSRSTRGPSSLVDFRLTVPRWMPVNLSGSYLEASIEGTTAEVTVETVHGNVRVVGGSGAISVRSVMGTITVDKASGRVQATTVNEGIRMTNVTGDMSAETTNGDIVVENAQTSNLEVSTVNGDVTFNGTVRDNGAYRFTTHSGDVRVGLGGAANATVFVRTFQGDFSSDFPIELPEGQSRDSGSKRFNFTLGTGSARIEVQSFNGDIHLARRTVPTAAEEREERRRGRRPGVTPPAPPAPPAPKPPPSPKPPPPPDGLEWPAEMADLTALVVEMPDLPDWELDVPDASDWLAGPVPPVPVVVPVPPVPIVMPVPPVPVVVPVPPVPVVVPVPPVPEISPLPLPWPPPPAAEGGVQ